MQIEMNFIGHIAENNSASQNHYDKNFDKFSEQCKYLFKLLMNGNKITVKEAILNHNINSLPRRMMDLKENLVQISYEWVYHESDTKYKVWFMNDENKIFNQKFLKK